MTMIETTRHPIKQVIYRRANDKAPCQTYQDIAGIMNTEIQTRPAVCERPNYQRGGEQMAPDHPTEEDGDTERVGSMS